MPILSNARSYIAGILVSLCMTGVGYSIDNSSVQQTKNKLRQLDTQINRLKQVLASANDKRGALNRELAGTEKQIDKAIQQLHSIQTNIDSKQQKIMSLEQHIRELNQQLIKQQQQLASHVRARYKIGVYQPVKWIINQDEPYSISRLLTFHQYIVQSRQHIIDAIDNTKKNLTLNQQSLREELTEQRKLQHRLHIHQAQLQEDKNYHKAVLQSLNNEIQSKEHTLAEFEHNKENLSRLLKTLALKSIVAVPRQAFSQMRHKLPRPIQSRSLQRMNQGVTFFAGEGTPVRAVSSGKIVFSDWLNGYGLLIIIDHGQGFMTLYAHNQSLFKRKGATVQQGEQIASVGHSGGIKQNGLYFEVRQRGKAVPPLEWLA
ncbi:peptidase, M23 family [Legionella birminghamensis]|uniref:Peptidase, M23 family n=1 Tax=Legionella birminghamensis TaxID=28083 RepID=A0A378IDV5_9GAMM|nr:peptidoglycan DD-metalloendopeptidase family protein [Legionella birminghamensis]KTC75475.1 peptidase, M23 family [Legionella birminghamensis]STX32701.1 peptidase, M23 family [Legionella birminghamensis]